MSCLEENSIFSTSLLQFLLHPLLLQVASDITKLRTSLLLQRIMSLIPEVLIKVIVQILSVSVGREVGKLVLDEPHKKSQYCGGDVKSSPTPPI